MTSKPREVSLFYQAQLFRKAAETLRDTRNCYDGLAHLYNCSAGRYGSYRVGDACIRYLRDLAGMDISAKHSNHYQVEVYILHRQFYNALPLYDNDIQANREAFFQTLYLFAAEMLEDEHRQSKGV